MAKVLSWIALGLLAEVTARRSCQLQNNTFPAFSVGRTLSPATIDVIWTPRGAL